MTSRGEQGIRKNGVELSKKYRNIGNGEILRFSKVGTTMNLACCDCGLVHNVIVKTVRSGKEKGSIDVVYIRDDRRTGQIRRWNKYPMEQRCTK